MERHFGATLAELLIVVMIMGFLAVMTVPLLSGIGWGWQVQQDETVVWAMVQHSLIWVIGLQFALPS